MAHTYRVRATCPPGTRIASIRGPQRSCARGYAQKDAQDRDSLKPRSTEYSQTGSDDKAAAMEKTAFNPHDTIPEEEQESADAEADQTKSSAEGNPLEVSPANPKISRPRNPQEGGAEASPSESRGAEAQRQRTSGGGSAPKAGGKKSG